MLRSVITAGLVLAAFACLVGGIVVSTSVDGDQGFGFGVALLCCAPAFACIALAMRFGLGGDE
jgi:hypothetical protein